MKKSDDTQLDFKPITPGLGFHPFSDGLPYAPVSQTATQQSATKNASAASSAASAATPSSGATAASPSPIPPRPFGAGSGAVAAGNPVFVSSPSRISVPVAQPAQALFQSNSRSRGGAHAPSVSPAPSATTAASATATAATEPARGQKHPEVVETRFGYAYVAKRATAYLIDSVFNIGACLGAISVALWNQNIQLDLLLNSEVFAITVLFFVAFNWAIITAQEIAFGTSLGKRIFGLVLKGPASAVFLRAFFFLPTAGFFGFGILWSLLDRKKRCWHDLIVDLQPTELARL